MFVRELGVLGGMKAKTPHSSIFHDYLMFEIQDCIVNINDLKEKKKSIRDEVARLNALAVSLAAEEKVDEGYVKKRTRELALRKH